EPGRARDPSPTGRGLSDVLRLRRGLRAGAVHDGRGHPDRFRVPGARRAHRCGPVRGEPLRGRPLPGRCDPPLLLTLAGRPTAMVTTSCVLVVTSSEG